MVVVLTINGLDVSNLVTMNWSESTVSSSESGRDASGTMYIDPITQKISLPLTFGMLTWSQISTILKKMDEKGTGGTRITVRYPDPKQGKFVTKDFYAQDRSAPMAVPIDGEIFWSGLSFTLTEI